MPNGNKTDNGVHEVGTEETRLAYQNDTPGQQVEEYLSQIALQNEEKQESARKHFSQVFDNPLKGFPHNEEFEVTDLGEDYKKVIKMYPRDNDWKKLITKHKRAIDDFRKNNKDLPSKVEDELLGWASQTGEVGGKDDAEDFIMSILDESTISENYRELAKHGMGAETKNSIKVGTEVDYYQKDGAKYMGKITKMTPKGYIVRDDKTKKDHEFTYHDRNAAKKLLKMSEEAHPCKGLSEDDPCWKDYKQVGMKKKNGKEVPNCVPKEDVEEGAMDGQKMTGQEISTYFRKNPIRDKDLKKAVEIALDHSGAMNYAIKQIEKLKKGLSKKTEVKKALQFANEEVKYKLNVGVVFTEDKKESVTEESMGDKIGKLFKTKNKKEIDGIANLMNMTDIKVLQSMQKQNPKGFKKMTAKMGEMSAMEEVKPDEPLKGKYPFQKKFSVESTFREMFETDLQEETIVYKVKGIQKPETDKFNQSAKMMKLKVSFKKQGSDTHVTMTGNKKQLRDFDSIARGKSSYGDPSTVQHFDESLEEAISRDKNLSKKDIDGIEDHIIKSYINKKTLSKISFDDDEIFHAGTGKTIFTSKDYIGKMTIDDLIKALEKKVK